jgi:hypothetical protein
LHGRPERLDRRIVDAGGHAPHGAQQPGATGPESQLVYCGPRSAWTTAPGPVGAARWPSAGRRRRVRNACGRLSTSPRSSGRTHEVIPGRRRSAVPGRPGLRKRGPGK